MRSPYTQMLTVPRHNLSFGSRAFRISAPKLLLEVIVSEMTYNVSMGTLNPTIPYHLKFASHTPFHI